MDTHIVCCTGTMNQCTYCDKCCIQGNLTKQSFAKLCTQVQLLAVLLKDHTSVGGRDGVLFIVQSIKSLHFWRLVVLVSVPCSTY